MAAGNCKDSVKFGGDCTDATKDTESSAREKAAPMYQTYWGLKQAPFALPACRQLVDRSPLCGEALERMAFLVENRSPFGLLIGPSGSGKSLVLDEFIRRQQAAGAAAVLLSAAGLQARDVLFCLACQWGCQPAEADDGGRLWRLVADRLAELRLEGLPAVVAVDDLDEAGADAQNLVQRLLSVPQAELTIVAAVRDENAATIGARLLELADLRIELTCWTVEETREHLKISLSHAGRQQPAFADRAVQRLFQLSGGVPRRVNQLAQLALVAGAGQGLKQIDEQTVLAVHEELAAAR
jgi:type II secretory pathway predicted ATPase ExeA